MTTTIQKILFSILLLNAALVILYTSATGQNFMGFNNNVRALTLINAKTDSKNFLGNQETSAPAIHPFDQLYTKLEKLEWKPERIDEVVRKYWNTGKTFAEYQYEGYQKTNKTTLTTSCLHTAAWIVQAMLELQTRPNVYVGLWKVPDNEELIVFNNTQDEAETLPVPAIKSMRNFIESRPSNESIVFQVDMYQVIPEPSYYYIDHHFVIHAYDGQISLYHSWMGEFDLVEWMTKPETRQQRYPMPIDDFFALLDKAFTYTEVESEMIERYEAIWKVFGITDTFVYGKKDVLDPIVRRLRYPWVMSLITHWPNALQSDEIIA